MISTELAQWIEAVYGCLSWPDPRIWCNQIGALAGAARTSVVAGTAMGVLATDSRSYGVLPLIEGVKFIQDAVVAHEQGATAKDIVSNAASARGGKPFIVGYIRPIAKGDERLEVLERVAKQLHMPMGKHLQLAYQIEQELMSAYDEGMNVNGYVSAVLSDYGFTEQEIYQLFSTLVASGVTACYLDTYHRPADTFLPLRCEDMDYQGPAPRAVPESI
jgi:citrate synthase